VFEAAESFKGSAKAKVLLQKLTDFTNVPRKKAKFFNFMKNSFRSFGVTDAILNELWSFIESIDNNKSQSQQNQNGQIANGNLKRKNEQENDIKYELAQNGTHTHIKAQNKKLKEKDESFNAENEENLFFEMEQNRNVIEMEQNEFDWIKEIESEIEKLEEEEIKFSKLEKRVSI
jgi:cell growth-regulating nucleolar protein